MFCPACGVKNEPGSIKCFVCGQTIRPLDAPGPLSGARPRSMKVVSSVDSVGSIGDRFLALLFDRALLASLLLVLAAFMQSEDRPSLAGQFGDKRWLGFSGIAVALLIFLYHVVFEGAFGATLGKAIFGLNVRNESNRNRFAAAVIRNVVRPIDAMGLYAVAFLVALFYPRKQRIGDLVARTIVLEYRIHPAARAMFLFMWVALVAGAVWLAWTFCPTCLAWRGQV